MAWRDVSARYKNSFAGVLWALVQPLAMLATYTFVFSYVLEMKWIGRPNAAGTAGHADYAVILYAGLLLAALFSDAVMRAPVAITGNTNLVKKVLFPLELLPLVPLVSALVFAGISLAALLIAQWWVGGAVPWTALYAPLVIAPLVVMAAGFAWGIAALSVYLPDTAQFITPLMSMVTFLSPVFYPLERLPVDWHFWMRLNPLTHIVEQLRAVTLWGQAPDWAALGLYSVAACGFALIGLLAFQALRKGFADVL